jgi:UDP-glucuronate decarboxylase
MKALVAGAAGFIGSHLCDRLIGEGVEVLAIDNLYTGRKTNLRGLEGNRGFRFEERDITRPFDPESVDNLDLIFNLACPASPPFYQRDPIFTLDTNYLGMKNLLELAVAKRARILQASTSEVYGDACVSPQPESYWGNVNCFGLRSCYDEGKRVAEALMLEYSRKYGIGIKIVRIFNTYGPHMDPNDGRVVSNFIVQALRGESLTVFGEGSQTRSFCYVDDLVRGLLAMMESGEEVTGPVNLGNPGEFTVLELAEMVIRQTESKSTIVHGALPSDDPKQRRPDISMAKMLLGWEPEVALAEGLEKTIEYFRGLRR